MRDLDDVVADLRQDDELTHSGRRTWSQHLVVRTRLLAEAHGFGLRCIPEARSKCAHCRETA